MARVYTKIGDVFCAKISEDTKKHFQLIAYDLTQLNSDVIRAFKKEYAVSETPDLSEIVAGEVEFYAHCVTKFGVKLNLWEKIGTIADIGKVEPLFRSSGDVGNLQVK